MENNDVNTGANSANNRIVNSGEPLINKLGLKAGQEVSLIKRQVFKDSAVDLGQKLEGRLADDVHIGSPIRLDNSNTSPVVGIKEEQDRYFIKTYTSIYELLLQSQKEGQLEKSLNLGAILNDIEANIHDQPESIQKIWRETKNKFTTALKIQNRNYIFTNVSVGAREQVLSLVQDSDKPNIWKPRVFRFSGSDCQWKSYPGRRADGSVMKGEENNESHHYVQSAKLHKDMYRAIESLTVDHDNVHYSEIVPKMGNDGKGGIYEKEFEFKEEYQTLKNPEWASFQDYCRRFFNGYKRFVIEADHFKNFTLEGGLSQWLKSAENIEEFRNIKSELEKLNANPAYQQILQKTSLSHFYWSSDANPDFRNFLEVYMKNVGTYVERCFQHLVPETMIPDFSLKNRIDTYFKSDILSKNKKNGITIEEYQVTSVDNDVLVYAMAYDLKGRVYIDNIYDPRIPANDYGTMGKITQMGHLVYKPEDYDTQAIFGINQKYIKQSDSGYIEIASLWENIPIVKKFKEELVKRGTLK